MVSQLGTQPSPVGHAQWMALAEREYARLLALLADLDETQWARPTDCPAWTVRQVVAHLAGAAQATASPRQAARQARSGRSLLPEAMVVDQMNATQVCDREHLEPAELVADLAAQSARGLRARRRLPAVVRAVPVPFGPPLGVRTIGYLMDRVYTRDAWMHRVDVCRATGRPLQLTAAHDGVIVADVVHEWARAHGRPVELTLTGAAGGRWTFGDGERERLELDAVELCRRLSGRPASVDAGSPLLDVGVPF